MFEPKYMIETLAAPGIAGTKPHYSIDYITELRPDLRLDLEIVKQNDGPLATATHYYEDAEGNRLPIIHITYQYTYNQEQIDAGILPQSHLDIDEKIKTWYYYRVDGTLDDSEEVLTYKRKLKKYKDRASRLDFGFKRRNNVYFDLSLRMGAAFIVFNDFIPSINVLTIEDANNILRPVSEQYKVHFDLWKTEANPNIYTDIETVTLAEIPWMDFVVPTDSQIDTLVADPVANATIKGAISLYGMEDMQGLSIRNYMLEKLKGNLK